MTYYLGVDIGTTFTGAAVRRDGRNEMVTLGNRAPVVPSVVYLRDDGSVLVGETANRRGLSDPSRVAREFKRRFGDPTPLLLGGSPQSPEALTARLLRWVVDTVSEREGGEPASVALTHPANWGGYKRDLLRQSVRLADLPDAVLLSEPEAAAIYYASLERVEPGTVVAVYDLGGGTFDAVLLRKLGGAGFEILGEPEGVERLGGVDFDEAVFRHVLAAAALEDLDASDAATVSALTRLRDECITAKESLSTDTDASIPVSLPGVHTEVRLTRDEFEEMIRPTLSDTLTAMRRALASAGVAADGVDRVLLVGGSSRIPLVSELVAREFGRPVALDAQPKHAVALGASITADDASDSIVAAPPPPAASTAVAAAGVAATGPADSTPSPSATNVPSTGEQAAQQRTMSPLVVVVAVLLLAVVVIGGIVMATRGGDEESSSTPTTLTGVPATTSAAQAATATSAPVVTTPASTAPAAAAPASTAPAAAAPATTSPPTSTIPPGPFVEITGVERDIERYVIEFVPHAFEPSLSGDLHVHLFWDTVERSSAGTNGVPAPGDWLVWDLPTTVDDPYFSVTARPPAATAVCALVANVVHEIADIDGDGSFDPDTGNCLPLS